MFGKFYKNFSKIIPKFHFSITEIFFEFCYKKTYKFKIGTCPEYYFTITSDKQFLQNFLKNF